MFVSGIGLVTIDLLLAQNLLNQKAPSSPNSPPTQPVGSIVEIVSIYLSNYVQPQDLQSLLTLKPISWLLDAIGSLLGVQPKNSLLSYSLLLPCISDLPE